MLLSYLNTQLRDFYPSFQECCSCLDLDPAGIQKTLESIGYRYDPEKNRFL